MADDIAAHDLMRYAHIASLEHNAEASRLLPGTRERRAAQAGEVKEREEASQWALVSIAESLAKIAGSLDSLDTHGIETYVTDAEGRRSGFSR